MKPVTTHPAYRADIDGLRAVAVLSVVGFHAFPGWVPGGFVGVDVFFVISGYLISTIIFGNLEKGTFRFSDFYARRVKRIFPALGVVLGACAVLGWFVLLPNELIQLGKHIAGGAGFVSNLVLWSEAGYFDGTAATKPLLHLWSLGIEEQFYLAWPVLLYAARRRRVVLLGTILVGSFALNVALVHAHPVGTFYSPFTRFWELSIGSTLAYVTLHEPPCHAERRLRLREVASTVGLLLLAVATARFGAEEPFPGWRALLPTMGAYLLIAAGPKAWLNRRVLSHRLLVWIGLISFPLYLWHWPLLAFARIVEAATPTPKIRIMAVASSFVLAWLTYALVETPIRLGKERRFTVAVLLSAIMGLLLLGLGLVAGRGFAAARGPWNVANVSQSYGRQDQFTERCRRAEAASFSPQFEPELDFCHSSKPDRPNVDVIVLGDSHAGRLYSGLRETSALSLLDLGRGSCLPFVGYEASNPGQERTFGCSPTMGQLVERAMALSPRAVVLSGFFARAYDGRVTSRAARPMKALMRETLVRLAAHVPRVLVVFDVPELPFDPSRCVDRPINRGSGRGRCAFAKADADRALALYAEDLHLAASDLTNVTFFNPADVLCEGGSCFAVANENLLYDDRHHLSQDGARLVGNALKLRLQ